ncbi:translation elongation factor 4 [Hydrogenibacillus schlegelii]|uniref:Elongation factor 4 n=2 Tax=Hydrogenibacillus schlegelii TaxID=1484 RepID=A0A2T5GE40_HYDSH|nr:translation elongation factor 4 [Hydrogenibacillus schlegelii]PTQ54453.1 MAG: Translation elongation factor LepA [Hydrogenibacillus schlegelii]
MADIERVPKAKIRNFSIIAHIDHGKSTLADRLLEATGAIGEREKEDQFLDQLELEKERGITIKLNTVRLHYRAKDGERYVLNLIDTPGHVDFTYEVSRSLAACEGALLVVDATQGIEAQTLANVYLALENDLEILPVINKIDLPSADPERVKREIEEVIGLDASEAVLASAKLGIGVDEILEQIVAKIPPPAGDPEAPLRALIFDSFYDPYRGVVALIRVKDGTIRIGDEILFMATGKVHAVTELGVFAPRPTSVEELSAGEVGYVAASVKTIADTRVGDTITHARRPAAEPLPGYRKVLPVVFAGLYPVDSDDYDDLKDALEKLKLNDAALTFEPETSQALGFGFRCGFLGLLHMEVVQERLEREFGLHLIVTAPSVVYRVKLKNGEVREVDNPSKMPDAGLIEAIEEPFIRATILVPNDHVGAVMELCQEKRGVFQSMDYLTPNRVQLVYDLPLAEVVFDFFNQLKSRTRGYASFDYELADYRPSNLVKMDILINGEPVDALSVIVHRDKAYYRGRALVEKLKTLIPRQLFEIPIQAAIGSRVIARETVKALRKNVLAKCYGGDVTRKRKLLEKQKEGKKRLKAIGSVEIPQEAFIAVLQVDEGGRNGG